MQIESATVVLFGIFIKLVVGTLYFVFWVYDRRATWFGWWSATILFAIIGAAFLVARGILGEPLAIAFGAAAIVAAGSMFWQGARAFNRRRPLLPAALAAPVVWFAACLVPGFLATLPYRVFLSSLLVSLLFALSAFEFWRGREERLISRWPVIAVLLSYAMVFASRILFINWLPFPFGALPEYPGAIGLFNMVLSSHTLVLTVLLVAISKERLELEQRTKAQTDPLTGVLNRRAFMARGASLLSRHKFDGAPLCVIFLDIDHFKSINDRFGHAGGDEALIKFVAVAQQNIRPTDFLFRIGGEEFCCLLPHTTAEQARYVAERIRRQFEKATIQVAGQSVSTTVSLGIASTEAFGYDIDALMRQADAAVYAAKRQGRNRVMVARAPENNAAAVTGEGGIAATTSTT
jgi:diguanylate cyclase (GGDEF)-like protein